MTTFEELKARIVRRERLSWLWNVCWPVWVLALAMEATQR